MTSRNLSDWLEYYLQYTQNSEPPTQYHLWSGIAAISSCLRRKCWSYWGMSGGDIYPNFYIALVGPPGGRKGTAMKFAKEMILDLGIPVSSDSLGSIQALYAEIESSKDSYYAEDGKLLDYLSLCVWAEELTVFISHQDSIFVKSITDLFDTPKSWRYSSLKRGIEPLTNCFLSIIGAITPSLLQDSLTTTSMGGGLFSRIIFVVGYGKIKKIPLGFLCEEEKKVQRMLYEDLEIMKNMAGQFKLTNEFMNAYAPWYMSVEATQGVDSDKFAGYNDRRALHLKKLCMVLSASEGNTMLIKAHHFQKALSILQYTENEMSNAFHGLGKGTHASVFTDLMRFIENNKKVNYKEVLGKFCLDATPGELQSHLNTLVLINKITMSRSTTEEESYLWIYRDESIMGLEHLNETVFNKMDR